ncbi:hypothetical protein ACQ4PT_009624 [Festuca glaucescens]
MDQSSRPVFRHTALRTWRRSLPLRVRPAPSRTENVVMGDSRARERATISWGGSISSSSSSSGSLANASTGGCRSRAAGTFTGADCGMYIAGVGAGRGTVGIMRGRAVAGDAGDDEVDEEDGGGERGPRRSGRASRMPPGGRRGRGLGFAPRMEEMRRGRRGGGCVRSGDATPEAKRSSSSSSKAAEAGWSPAAAGGRKEPRKRSELGELLWRARSMARQGCAGGGVTAGAGLAGDGRRHW